MSVKQDVIDLIEKAKDELHKIEGLAVSELNRVEAGIQHAWSAAVSMTEPAPVEEPAVAEKPAPVEKKSAAEKSSGS